MTLRRICLRECSKAEQRATEALRRSKRCNLASRFAVFLKVAGKDCNNRALFLPAAAPSCLFLTSTAIYLYQNSMEFRTGLPPSNGFDTLVISSPGSHLSFPAHMEQT